MDPVIEYQQQKQTHFMKKIISIIALTISLSLPLVLSAQAPPHPNGGNNPTGGGNTPVGGNSGAPIGSGTVLLTLMAAAYGGLKSYRNQAKVKQER
jgi:hypothetical protein